MREGDDDAEQDSIANPSLGAHEIGGDHGLAVTGGQRMAGTEEKCQQQDPDLAGEKVIEKLAQGPVFFLLFVLSPRR